MPRSRVATFTTVRSEGALLPPDFLRLVAEGRDRIPGLTPDAYHLPGNERLNEATSRSWNRLLGAWGAFQAASQDLKATEPGTTVTREKWLLPLFQELGYGRLLAARAFEVQGKTYPISHAWQHTPIHLVGRNIKLDERSPGVTGAARVSPHGLVQEFLNRSPDHLWGFLSNGLRLRILRNSKSLTRQAYVEFDLAEMMEGQVYADFALLWLLCHQSRVEAERPQDCWLEQWAERARQEGTRALEHLRRGVEQAIEALGRGFLAHPGNRNLSENLRSGTLDKQDYYRQLLRTVYRLIFLFVAEDRDLLLTAKRGSPERDRYVKYYSVDRLRTLADRRRGSPHGDLWRGFRLVVEKLSSEAGCPELGLPALGSYLWSSSATPDLDRCELANLHLLDAVRALAFIVDGGIRRPVDFKSLGPEELGSVYESLLELHPKLNGDAATFSLTTAAGHERKTTGSYYTPTSLVECLLDTALDPVIAERLEEAGRMATSEWRMVHEPYRKEFVNYAHRQLSRSGGLAARPFDRQAGVPPDEGLPERGTVRHDGPDSSGGDRDPSQHRGGLGEALSSGIHPVSSNSEWQPDRAGDSSDRECGRGPVPGIGHPAIASGDRHTGQAIAHLGAQSPTETEIDETERVANGERRMVQEQPHPPLATRHSPFAEKGPHPPFAIHDSQLAALWSRTPLATRHSLFAEKALLSLKVCDPACGSGHFLIAAAHRMANRLAAVRTGDEEPAPEAVRTALRDVIGHCIYGVDVNPMAVELCKVNLWLEALEPGKPLSFLEHRIQCGNSLLGATPALLRKGIPDEAFEPIEGDDKKYCQRFKKENKKERAGQLRLLEHEYNPWDRRGNLATAILELDAIPDDTLAGQRAKQARWESLVRSSSYESGRLLADTWCAAFVWKKAPDPVLQYPITEDTFRRIEQNPHWIPDWMRHEIVRLAGKYGFFHWHLAFPNVFTIRPEYTDAHNVVGWEGGFEVVIGNPPWDTLSPDGKEFFSACDPQVRFEDRDGQARIIQRLLEDQAMARSWTDHCRSLYSQVHFFKDSGRYTLFAPGNLGKGDFNVYRMFIEAAMQITREGGRVAQIVPEGMYNGANCMAIRKELLDHMRWDMLLGFENAREVWFKGIHSSAKFCIYCARKAGSTSTFRAVFNIRNPEELRQATAGRALIIPAKVIPEFSPEALAIMELSDQRDIDIAQKMYANWPKFGDASAGEPHRQYMREIDMGNDRDLFSEDPSGLPLYEGRMVDQFDHRAKAYRSGRGRVAVWADLPFGTSEKSIRPQWYIPAERIPEKVRRRVREYRVGFCDVTSPTNGRTLLATLIPPGCLCGHSVPTIAFPDPFGWAYLIWLAVANSFSMDFLARQKATLHMTYTILDSLPFPRLAVDDKRVPRIAELALGLCCTGSEMTAYWNSMAKFGWVDPAPDNQFPPCLMDDEQRLEARAELDAIVARDLFGLTRDEMEYILGTFPVVERKEKEKYGSFRSRELILQRFD